MASSGRSRLRLDWMPSLHPKPFVAENVGAEVEAEAKARIKSRTNPRLVLQTRWEISCNLKTKPKTWVKKVVEVADGVVVKAVDEVVVETKDEEEEAQILNVLCVEKLDTSKVHVQKARSSRNG